MRPHSEQTTQLSPSVLTAVNKMAIRGLGERGAVFTRGEVAECILDLVGYTLDRPLHQLRLLEPSFGNGDFLLPVVSRLFASYANHRRSGSSIVDDLSDSIRAVEIHRESIHETSQKVFGELNRHGVSTEESRRLIDAWLVEGDFLLAHLPHSFTHVVGNPPYLRQEMIPEVLIAEYRSRYKTIFDRADLYVPFIERSLTMLDDSGVLGFICADRWMKNRYGGPLRSMVAEDFHLQYYIDMVDTKAFQAEVTAYPAITVIKRGRAGPTRIARRPAIDSDVLTGLARDMRAESVPAGSGVTEFDGVMRGREPWILQSLEELSLVRRLEADYPSIEDVGCKVGIGVATGADRVFIAPFDDLMVEPDRKLPLVMTRDIRDGRVRWRGLGVINPFCEDGSLVNLDDYPLLRKYLEQNREVIQRRNCAKKTPKRWYRTIDRIYPELAKRSKLLIPDIKGSAHVVFEEGRFYPHHNLYFVTSRNWDLVALQAVLRSRVAELFVSMYSTRMRGGYLRFQAQYLRRIRIPRWELVSGTLREELVTAARSHDVDACNRAAFDLYEFTSKEKNLLAENRSTAP